ncbi:hypothetical protein A4X09_0g2260 [Tilletia walkeri]|uniref:Velvet domain-containing protein n=1 Tax=Tilletia walkeri TaxID=117179 RepID=A0A8X7ND49_9BASI|nr:hypothetical protein A4X09_0g2260 [Tilletia walkeri]
MPPKASKNQQGGARAAAPAASAQAGPSRAAGAGSSASAAASNTRSADQPPVADAGVQYHFVPVPQVLEGRDRIEYILTIREQPKQSRMCGSGEKADRRPVDPAPIVQLRVITHETTRPGGSTGVPPHATIAAANLPVGLPIPRRNNKMPLATHPIRSGVPVTTAWGAGWEDKAWFLENPYYFMYAMLADAETDAELLVLSDGRTRSTTGSCVSCLYHLKDVKDNSDQGFFVFPDLSIRSEGRYRLKLSLFETIGNEVHHCKSIYTAPFTVHSAKGFPGMNESTVLARSFASQGLKLRVRKNPRGRKKNINEQSYDSEEDDSAEQGRGPSTKRIRSDSHASYQQHAEHKTPGSGGGGVVGGGPPISYQFSPAQGTHQQQQHHDHPSQQQQHHDHPSQQQQHHHQQQHQYQYHPGVAPPPPHPSAAGGGGGPVPAEGWNRSPGQNVHWKGKGREGSSYLHVGAVGGDPSSAMGHHPPYHPHQHQHQSQHPTGSRYYPSPPTSSSGTASQQTLHPPPPPPLPTTTTYTSTAPNASNTRTAPSSPYLDPRLAGLSVGSGTSAYGTMPAPAVPSHVIAGGSRPSSSPRDRSNSAGGGGGGMGGVPSSSTFTPVFGFGERSRMISGGSGAALDRPTLPPLWSLTQGSGGVPSGGGGGKVVTPGGGGGGRQQPFGGSVESGSMSAPGTSHGFVPPSPEATRPSTQGGYFSSPAMGQASAAGAGGHHAYSPYNPPGHNAGSSGFGLGIGAMAGGAGTSGSSTSAGAVPAATTTTTASSSQAQTPNSVLPFSASRPSSSSGAGIRTDMRPPPFLPASHSQQTSPHRERTISSGRRGEEYGGGSFLQPPPPPGAGGGTHHPYSSYQHSSPYQPAHHHQHQHGHHHSHANSHSQASNTSSGVGVGMASGTVSPRGPAPMSMPTPASSTSPATGYGWHSGGDGGGGMPPVYEDPHYRERERERERGRMERDGMGEWGSGGGGGGGSTSYGSFYPVPPPPAPAPAPGGYHRSGYEHHQHQPQDSSSSRPSQEGMGMMMDLDEEQQGGEHGAWSRRARSRSDVERYEYERSRRR